MLSVFFVGIANKRTPTALVRELRSLFMGPLRDFVAVALPHHQGALPPAPLQETEFLDFQPLFELERARV